MGELEPLTMPIEEAMRTQRAIRRLTNEPVDDALVRRLIELALKAPTAKSRLRAWSFTMSKASTSRWERAPTSSVEESHPPRSSLTMKSTSYYCCSGPNGRTKLE